jgi:uncharacterized protein (TIGR02452 family)
MDDNRNQRVAIARETISILNEGAYRGPLGKRVDLRASLAGALQRTELIRPEDWAAVYAQAMRRPEHKPVQVEVTAETTLAAAKRLSTIRGSHVLVLSFASAKKPGGGFLGGARAQEESLARASGLYQCLLSQPEYYERNRDCGKLLYTDHAIHSPEVPIFRDDAGRLLEAFFLVGILTMPAPNIGAMPGGSAEIEQVVAVLRRRAEHVLALAVARDYTQVVAGAWGCGVFRNDPAVVAEAFAAAIDIWGHRLERITFAIADRAGRNRSEFVKRLSPDGRG